MMMRFDKNLKNCSLIFRTRFLGFIVDNLTLEEQQIVKKYHWRKYPKEDQENYLEVFM